MNTTRTKKVRNINKLKRYTKKTFMGVVKRHKVLNKRFLNKMFKKLQNSTHIFFFIVFISFIVPV